MLSLRVEIGSVLRQQARGLQLPLKRRDADERKPSTRIGIGSEIKKLPDGRGARHGIVRERGHSGVCQALQRETGIDEDLPRLRMIAVRDSQQLDLLSCGAFRIGPVREQQPHGLDVPSPRRGDQRSGAVSRHGVDRRPAIEEQPNRRGISSGPHEGRRAAVAGRIDVRAAIEQHADRVRRGKDRGMHQRRGADVVARVWIGRVHGQRERDARYGRRRNGQPSTSCHN